MLGIMAAESAIASSEGREFRHAQIDKRKCWRPKTNIPLILMCHTALLAVEAMGIVVEWTKVVSHTGDTFNERADRLAKCGGQGTRHYDMEVMVYITNSN